MTSSIQELTSAYRSTAIAWDLNQRDAKKANPLFKQLHAIYKQLRDHDDGRAWLVDLMRDPTVGTGVRLIAASHCLGWDPAAATEVLQGIERDSPGLHSVTAEYTLKAFRAGTLDMDW